MGVQGWERSDGVIEAGWILVQVGGTPGGIVTIPTTVTPAATTQPSSTATAVAATGDGTPGATRRPTTAVGGTPLPPARTRVGMPLEFRGFVETAPSGSGFVGQWVVSGRRVNVSSGTRITQQHGELVKGAYVQVHGWVQADGSINAAYVMTKKDNVSDDDKSVKLKWQGRIDQLPASGTEGVWIVNGLRVLVDANTDIKPRDGKFVVGAEIEVTGTVAANGDLRAEKIRLAGKDKDANGDDGDKDKDKENPGKQDNPGKGKASDSNPGKGKGNDK